MLKPNIGCGDGETEPMENLHLGNNIDVGHYEKIEKWLPFCKYALYRKNSNNRSPQSLDLWFSECQQIWNIIGHYEKIEKWPLFHKYVLFRKISNYQSPQSLGLWFSKCQQKWIISVSHYEKI